MRLEKLAAFSEIVSSLAIVITLAFLTMQTREMAQQTEQTNSALFANSRATTMSADINFLLEADGWLVLQNKPPEELSSEDRDDLTRQFLAYLRIREFAYFQYQDGILDRSTWESYLSATGDLLVKRNTAPIWENYRRAFDAGFVDAIETATGNSDYSLNQ